MKLGLILTNDWELFGNGSGDFFELQHKPLIELLEILQFYKSKITIMAEVGQQLAFKKLVKFNKYCFAASNSWEKILRAAVRQGHDVQLHYHPQWLYSKYENKKWQLDMENWHISGLPAFKIESVLSTGKYYLESVLQPVKPDYRCIAFRAGGYAIQPERNVIAGLKKAGIICDTSVTKGLVNKSFYDFRKAKSNIIPWFTTDGEVTAEGTEGEGLLEIPIYSVTRNDSPAFRKFFPSLYYRIWFGAKIGKDEMNWQIHREKIKSKRYPAAIRYYKKENKNIGFYLSSILSKRAIQLDYDYLPPTAFVKILKDILRDRQLSAAYRDTILPVVASGHLKDAHNNDNLGHILDKINTELGGSVTCWTLTEAVDYWLNILK